MFNKFDHLLNRGIISKKDLEIASEISKKYNQSIETILNYHFLVPKSFIGKSLSLHFKCDFISYDPELPIATEMFQGLHKAMLLRDCWVPIGWDEEGVLVLIDDPFDFTKRAIIETAFEFLPIIYAVGIKEDIKAFINLSFDQNEIKKLILNSEFAKGPPAVSNLIDNVLICL